MAVTTPPRTRKGPPKFINKAIVLLLSSPFNGRISHLLMLLTFKGRKSGKRYTIPVGYMREGDIVEVFTDRGWWKNLLGPAPVTVRIEGKKLRGMPEVISDQTDVIAERLTAFVRLHPGAARAYDVQMESDGQPEPASIQRAACRFKLIRIHLA